MPTIPYIVVTSLLRPLDSRFGGLWHRNIHSVYGCLCVLPKYCFSIPRGPRDPTVNQESVYVMAVTGLQGTDGYLALRHASPMTRRILPVTSSHSIATSSSPIPDSPYYLRAIQKCPHWLGSSMNSVFRRSSSPEELKYPVRIEQKI